MSGRKNEREDEFHFYKNTVSCVRFKGMPCLQGNYFEEVKSSLKMVIQEKLEEGSPSFHTYSFLAGIVFLMFERNTVWLNEGRIIF